MSETITQTRPAWQTDELQEEWVEQDSGDDSDINYLTDGTRSISLTAPLATHIHTNSDIENDVSPSTTSHVAGTFLIREDVLAAPLLPKTPGRNKKTFIKDFFRPLPLERMFEPPSPPSPPAQSLPPASQGAPSGLLTGRRGQIGNDKSDGILEKDVPNMASFDGKTSLKCQFTFAVPRQISLDPNGPGGAHPQAQSTPNPPFPPTGTAPSTDPRLRLFQFQYDTFTREHLSAMVDSIAVNTASGTGTTASQTSFTHGLTRVSEGESMNSSTSHLRSTKRVKLSPPSDYYGEGAGAGASIARPRIFGKDYVGESRSLMQQIKEARDFSTISTVASAGDNSPGATHGAGAHDPNVSNQATPAHSRRPSFLSIPENVYGDSSSSGATLNSKNCGSYSSSTYRQQALALMAQIKTDMRGQKRLFSGDTDVSHVTTHQADGEKSFARTETPELLQVLGRPYPLEKENLRDQSQRHQRTSSVKSGTSSKGRQRAKFPGRLSAADKAESPLANEVSNMPTNNRSSHIELTSPTSPAPARASLALLPLPSNVNNPTPGLLAPPSHLATYPSASIRSGTNEDLNRFVSSSTASGTTLASGSAPSFVKHPGPPQIRTIAPEDVPSLPDKLGNMMFDKVMMKWVKTTAQATAMGEDMRDYVPDETSEDPFGDIESLKDDSKGMDLEVEEGGEMKEDRMSRIEELSEVDDEEEMELTSFSFDDPSAGIVPVMTGVETEEDNDQTTDSEDEDNRGVTITDLREVRFDSEDDQPSGFGSASEHSSPQRPSVPIPAVVTTFSTPLRKLPLPSSTTPIIRSALKSHSTTPTSALKNPKHRTPLRKIGHRRSVSFSDGKRDGPIRGLSRGVHEIGEGMGTIDVADPSGSRSTAFVPSARSKRIAAMMGALEDTDSDEDESPSKTTSSGRPEALQLLTARQPNNQPNVVAGSSNNVQPRRVFSRSQTQCISPGRSSGSVKANATFLTECSFGVAHDRLVQVITDVQPFEPHWEDLSSIDLSNKNVESVARLKEFLPRLISLSLNSNQLSWLSGVPGTVRTLSVASNNITGITSYSHLLNLENLDVSRNDISSLRQLECLRHLRELRADANKISSMDGLQRMSSLMKLSLQGNCIRSVDLTQCRWGRLEMLNLSQNRLDNMVGLASLPSLIALNIDNNSLGVLTITGSMPRLRILRASGNRLHQLDVGSVRNLRTLYLDNNSLGSLTKMDCLTKLENLSLRNQSGCGLNASNLLTRDVRDVKRLYLSGNPLKTGFLEEPCYSLVYLELAACRLTSLPEDLVRLVPNLRVLNLNYNFLEDIRSLEGLTRLKKLTIIGSRLRGTKPLIRLLQRMPDVEMLDFRMNPCTLGWYLPLLVKDVPGALQPSEDGGAAKGNSASNEWQDLDSKFRRDLPNDTYVGRLAFRGLVMRACPRIRMLDGVEVTEKERAKADRLLVGIVGKGKKPKECNG